MKKNSILNFSFFILTLLLSACGGPSSEVLNQEDTARVLVDLELANAMTIDFSNADLRTDSAHLALRSSVLAKHGINEAVMDTTMKWYGAHLKEYMDVLDRADSLLADTLRRIDEEMRLASAAAAGDTLQLWTLPPSVVFARNQPLEFVAFELETDTTWHRGDVVTLDLVLDNARSPLYVTLGADYANRGRTTDVVRKTHVGAPGEHLTLKLQLDDNLSVSRIFCYMQMKPAEGERAFADSIRLMRSRMVSDEYNEWRRFTQRLRRNAL